MKRRAALLPALITLAACQGSETTQPGDVPLALPSFLISDGAHAGGNPDFFFLWPMVATPSESPELRRDTFNANLQPTVNICALNATTTERRHRHAACKSRWLFDLRPAITPASGSPPRTMTSALPPVGPSPPRATSSTGSGVRRTDTAGFADVKTQRPPAGLRSVNPNLFMPQLDGTNLPIQFRIEQNALCQGVGPCTSRTINLATGGIVTTDLTGSRRHVRRGHSAAGHRSDGHDHRHVVRSTSTRASRT